MSRTASWGVEQMEPQTPMAADVVHPSGSLDLQEHLCVLSTRPKSVETEARERVGLMANNQRKTHLRRPQFLAIVQSRL